MVPLALLFTLAAVTRVDLVDQVYSIPADKWHYVDVGLKQRPAMILAHYDSPDSRAVRVALMRRHDVENLFEGYPYGVIAETGQGRSGTLRAQVAPGDYVVVVDNRESSRRSATVHLRVWVDFSNAPPLAQISPERQLAVILISFAVFFAIVGYSMMRIRGALKRSS